MKVFVYSAYGFEKDDLSQGLFHHEMQCLETKLTLDTASLAKRFEVASSFVNDDGAALVLQKLQQVGVKYLALRSAGVNHVDLSEAEQLAFDPYENEGMKADYGVEYVDL